MGNIQMVGKSQGPMYKGEKPIEAGLAPMFTLDEVAKHAVDFWLSTEDLPRPDNRVTLARDGNIKLSYTPNNQVPKQQLYDKLKSMLNHLRMHEHLIPRNLYMKNEIPIGGVAHQAGTCRFGTDPKTSVLDANCKAHELDNLYVVDTSFFPSIGAVNPALTAMANALRVGDHLLERLCTERLAVVADGCGTTRPSAQATRATERAARLRRRRRPGRGARHLPGGQHHLHEPRLLRPVQHGLRGHVPAPGCHGDRGVAAGRPAHPPSGASSASICWGSSRTWSRWRCSS